jgi:TRAP-type C4-dicarboxylate transport system permease small subunit
MTGTAFIRGSLRILDHISVVLVYVAAFALSLMIAFVCLSAAMRYVVKSPFHFTEEFVALLFLVTVFFPLPYAAIRKMNITVMLVTARLRGKARTAMAVVASVVTVVFAAWFTLLAYDFTAFAHDIGAVSEETSITLWPWMAMLPLAGGLMALIGIFHLLQVLGGADADDTENREQDASV